MTDFLRRVVINADNLLTDSSYYTYEILDGETPDVLADRIYSDINLYWIILVTNNIFDPRWEWPLSTNALNAYITDTYGSGHETDIHHYVNEYGDVVHSSYAGTKTAISNQTYETDLNEARRSIIMLKPQYISKFIDSFQGLIANG
jgi:hypothetical protein